MSVDGLNVSEAGTGNVLDIVGIKKATNSKILINGSNNRISIAEGCVLSNFSLTIEGDGNELTVGANARLTGHFIMKFVPGNRILIGQGTTIGGANIICGEGKTVDIGKDAMLSWGIEIRTTDSHAIFDKETGERVNFSQDIVIQDHVWLGAHTTLLGGACVPSGCVIGIRALVSSPLLEPDAVYGGVPARLLRSNIRWERPLLG